jgi:hypothetical protein
MASSFAFCKANEPDENQLSNNDFGSLSAVRSLLTGLWPTTSASRELSRRLK